MFNAGSGGVLSVCVCVFLLSLRLTQLYKCNLNSQEMLLSLLFCHSAERLSVFITRTVFFVTVLVKIIQAEENIRMKYST